MKRFLALIIALSLCAGQYAGAQGTYAGQTLVNGGDTGVAGTDDKPGDTLLSFVYNSISSCVATNSTTVTVAPAYAIESSHGVLAGGAMPGGKAYYAVTVTNCANTIDTLRLSAAASGQNWSVRFLKDDNGDGLRQPGEATEITSTGPLNPDTAFRFLMEVSVPSSASVDQQSFTRLTVADQDGSGTEDAWPVAGNDTVVYVATTTCVTDMTAPVIELSSANPRGHVGVIGNRVLIAANVSDPDTSIVSVKLNYRIDSGSMQQKDMTIVNGSYECDLSSAVAAAGECTLRYSVAALNSLGLTADSSEISVDFSRVTTGATLAEGTLTIPDANPGDGETKVIIPHGALDHPIALTVEQKVASDVPQRTSEQTLTYHPVAAYEFGPTGTMFSKPVTLVLQFFDLNHDGREDTTGQNVSTLRVFWDDGRAWRDLGGTVDAEHNTITVTVTHFSTYAIFPARRPSTSDLRPKEKIITPNGDGKNDFAVFGQPDDSKIKIYDINGKTIRSLDGVLSWDGRDDSGKVVESGVYIYQFRAGGKMLSGVIVVAK